MMKLLLCGCLYLSLRLPISSLCLHIMFAFLCWMMPDQGGARRLTQRQGSAGSSRGHAGWGTVPGGSCRCQGPAGSYWGWRAGVSLPLCTKDVAHAFELWLFAVSPMQSLCTQHGALLEVAGLLGFVPVGWVLEGV